MMAQNSDLIGEAGVWTFNCDHLDSPTSDSIRQRIAFFTYRFYLPFDKDDKSTWFSNLRPLRDLAKKAEEILGPAVDSYDIVHWHLREHEDWSFYVRTADEAMMLKLAL